MDLIRLIKLKRISGDLGNLSEQEEFFLSFFNNLTKFGSNNYMNSGKCILFSLDLNKKVFWCSYYIVWNDVKSKFNIDNKSMINLIYDVLHKLGMSDYTVNGEESEHHDKLDRIVKNVWNIINGW